MIVLDTNALVRIAAQDHTEQVQAVLALLENQPVRVLDTVILETAWVLKSRYGFTPKELVAYFRYLAASDNVFIQNPVALENALAAVERGMEFADALHLALSSNQPFHTFDALLHRRAVKQGFNVHLIKTGRSRTRHA